VDGLSNLLKEYENIERKLKQDDLGCGFKLISFEDEVQEIFNSNYKDIFYGNESQLLTIKLELSSELLQAEKLDLCEQLGKEGVLDRLRKIEEKLVDLKKNYSRMLKISVN
jgi:RNA binding exosome subunit